MTSVWSYIVKTGNYIDTIGVPFKSSFSKAIGDGATTSFWNDKWIGGDCLKNKFKRLARLDLNLDASVAIKPGCPDAWQWQASNNGIYTTKILSDLVEVFIWRARKKRLPVLIELDNRGIDLHSTRCPICDDDVESVDHSLFQCKLAHDIWFKVRDWWGVSGNAINIDESFRGKSNHRISELGMKIWQAVQWKCGYLIWKDRNQKVFKNKCWNPPVALDEIQIKSFEWIARRCKTKAFDWHTWLHT
ncbi:uncharacterized protein [Rutidosis leptorrhynchoides]|uniref:uncharacterized protein n=1 Tax=Rutidosis leptorrhynchoides TaxID=125765 RepID=UPI003A998796